MRRRGIVRCLLCLAVVLTMGVAAFSTLAGICCRCLDEYRQRDDNRLIALEYYADIQAEEIMRIYLAQGMEQVQIYADRENISYVILKTSGRRLGGNYRSEDTQQIQMIDGHILQYSYWFSGEMQEKPQRVPKDAAEYLVKIAYLEVQQMMAPPMYLEGLPLNLEDWTRGYFFAARIAFVLMLAGLWQLLKGSGQSSKKQEAYAGRMFKMPVEKLLLWWIAAVAVWLWGCGQPFVWDIPITWDNGPEPMLSVLGQSVWRMTLWWMLLGILLLGFVLHLSVYVRWGQKKYRGLLGRVLKAPRETWKQVPWFNKVLIALVLFCVLEAVGIGLACRGVMHVKSLESLQGWLSGHGGWIVWLLWGAEKMLMVILTLRIADSIMRLKTSGRELAGGNLGYQIPLEGMTGDMLCFAQDLNAISHVVADAVADQIKSEHLKTELITNVSHDIKTPLTSIINYADLIGRDPLDSDKTMEYAQVLYRQSTRLKKLIEDLMEVSKAATGNLEVYLERCQAGVLLSQAMGEFEQRLQERGIDLIVKQCQEPVWIMADTRMLWRILDNLMTNICKYAQSETRVYLLLETTSLKTQEEQAVLTFKNISSQPLDMDASELMERFVRGDKSRHTEGNGLGLAIAKNLTELQGGSMQLVTDGDLFKVILTFPIAPQPEPEPELLALHQEKENRQLPADLQG
ncbi:MAG: HAMP domain-containing histidine kinase [Lachnospiraceae bacterium]|nr:HAMP domain-containing histidine kinase [Lachnospiraceae bacterium]